MPQAQADPNTVFLQKALERNYAMPNFPVTGKSQVIDIEFDAVPGWAKNIDLAVKLNIDVTVPAGGTAPSFSPFAPWNFFSKAEIQLGGGPFQRVSPFFYYLKEMLGMQAWTPDNGGAKNYPYATSVEWSTPALAATVGSTVTNTLRFNIRIPLQVQDGSAFGLIPMGNAATKLKLRLTVANDFYGSDQYLFPINGGSGAITTAVTAGQASWVQPNVEYLTAPAYGKDPLPVPIIQRILNIQEKATPLTATGTLVPIKFPDPFVYLRLYHILVDGTGAPNTVAASAFELDLMPGYPQYSYQTEAQLQNYFYKMRRHLGQDLPVGTFLFDLFSGHDIMNPSGTQMIDATVFQTMQTQMMVASGTNVSGGMAKIITFAEALAPIAF